MSSSVVPLVHVAKWGEITPVGTGFVVASYGRHSILVSALHVFRYAAQLDGERERHHATALSAFLPPRAPYKFRQSKVCALVIRSDRAHFAELGTVMHYTGTDLVWVNASFVDTAPEDARFASRLAIDTDPPEMGAEVFAVGFPVMDSSWQDELKLGELSGELQSRRATVTELFPDGYAPLKLGPSMRIDAPISSGMSGGPVVRNISGRWVACGVNTSDETTEAESASGLASIAQMLSPLRSFHMQTRDAPDQPIRNVPFDDLVSSGLIEDIAALRRS